MRVLILGSGVIGTTAAHYLNRDGHEVTVVDRQPGAGLETSYANAGEVSPGYSSPWAGPGVPLKAVKWLLMHHSPLVVKPMMDPAMWRWCLAMLRNCTHARYEVNKRRMVRLAEYSRDQLKALRESTGIHYDERMQGTLQLFRTQKQLDDSDKDVAVLQRDGVPHQLLDMAGCIRHEPALARVQGKFVGGLRLPGDETGDCLMFTQRLAERAAAQGVRFAHGLRVLGLDKAGDAIQGVRVQGVGPDGSHRTSPPQTLTADLYLCALGSYSPLLLRPLGLSLPVYPVKGFSITAPIVDARAAPESTVMDETHKVAITRLGDRIRVGGTAQLSGYDLSLSDARRATLDFVLNDCFPGGGDLARATFWTGLRPMTPDGTPLLGPTPVRNLMLATGHGTLGWTMAAGTGRVLADLVAGRTPEIDTEGLGLARYRA